MTIGNVGIIILNYNTYEDTVCCVETIDNHVNDIAYKVYIIDNHSSDGSGKKLQTAFCQRDDVVVLLSDKNLGFSGGNNIGIKKALEDGNEYIFLFNSDVLLLNDAINPMLNVLMKNQDVSVVGPAVYNTDGEYVQFARKALTLKSYIYQKKPLKMVVYRKSMDCYYYNYDINENFVFDGMTSGCCFGLSADFIIQNHCLDDKIFMYYEEDILAHILIKNNKKACIVSDSRIVHKEGVATEKTSEDQLLFTRLYRWTAALYVLRAYANANAVVTYLIGICDIVVWAILSLFRRNYRKNLRKYIGETIRMLRID